MQRREIDERAGRAAAADFHEVRRDLRVHAVAQHGFGDGPVQRGSRRSAATVPSIPPLSQGRLGPDQPLYGPVPSLRVAANSESYTVGRDIPVR